MLGGAALSPSWCYPLCQDNLRIIMLTRLRVSGFKNLQEPGAVTELSYFAATWLKRVELSEAL